MNLDDVGDIVGAAALIHNFIIDERAAFFESLSHSTIQYLDEPSIPDINVWRTEIPDVLVTDNNEPNPGGRPTKEKNQSKEDGKLLREIISLHLKLANKTRPKRTSFKYNDLGMVYMDY